MVGFEEMEQEMSSANAPGTDRPESILEGTFRRRELNGHWVQYEFLDRDNEVTRRVAFPRVPIISDEVISEGDLEDEREAVAS
jgi:hypothetical protein